MPADSILIRGEKICLKYFAARNVRREMVEETRSISLDRERSRSMHDYDVYVEQSLEA